jgi:hypothetical protein
VKFKKKHDVLYSFLNRETICRYSYEDIFSRIY